MSIKEHLLKGEEILAECRDKEYKLYATNKRLLKYKSGGLFSKEVLYDISYKEITAVSLEITRGSKGMVISGIILTILSYITRTILFWSIIFFIVGVTLIIMGAIYKKSYFQFKGPNLLKEGTKERKIWRIEEVERSDVKDFVRIVREQLMKREEL